MMRKSAAILLFLITVLLLSACKDGVLVSSEKPGVETSSEPNRGGTIGAVCGDALLAFDNGASDHPLVSLDYRDGQACSFEIQDQDVIGEIFRTLLTVPLGKAVDDPGILDADLVFSFTHKNGGEFTVRFVTQKYLKLYQTADANWIYYEVADTSLVRRCKDAAMAANEKSILPENSVHGDLLALDLSQSFCEDLDLDGDGQNDSLFFDFIDNGDEAYGALNLTLETAGGSFSQSFYPAEAEAVSACCIPDSLGRSLLILATEAEGSWPSCLFFLTVQSGKLMQCTLENVKISDYGDGIFTLSDMRKVAVAEIKFQAVAP